MKTRAIPGVKKDICTAEQKIAYNLAFAYSDLFRGAFLALKTEAARSEAASAIRDKWLDWYKDGYSYKPGKYNEDAIFVALNNGIKKYMEKPFIAADYETIGNCFSIPYEEARQ